MRVRRADEGLLIAGTATLVASYLATATLGTLDASPGYSVGFTAWAPIAGGVIWGVTSYGLGALLIGLSGTALQTLGLVLLIVGAVGHEVDVEASSVLLLPSAPGADVGASLMLRF